ncbi:hypothetical protein CC80DRAFT_495526 [Byssothecium circinans]|uniref:RBR-type E3 ubiquitin transferase n=1 Tax=Byssothecium circinans TaxID=147558 RepID=A0A6A5THE4_9PLEO|nr:hypothetical protein CC80DRAFT_495526 [Byssothecium circinans]
MAPTTRSKTAKNIPPATRKQARKIIGSNAPKPSIPPTDRVLRPRAIPSSPTLTRTPKRKPAKVRSPPPTHYTCRICVEEKPIDTFVGYVNPRSPSRYRGEVPPGCISHVARHARSTKDPVCKTCIGQSMVARLSLVGARQVSNGCLEPGCNTVWNWESILRFFPHGEHLDEYGNDMLQVFLAKSDTVTCPNPECSAQGLFDRLASGFPQVQCHSSTCKLRFCVTCNVPWHEGIACADIAARNLNANMTAPEKAILSKLKKKDARRCPNCQIIIEKDGGCNGMFCTGCNKYFDWETAASVVPGQRKALPVHMMWGAVNHGAGKDGHAICEADVLEADYKKAKGG